MNRFGLDGKRYLVAGLGGIGSAIAKELLADGARLIVTDVNSESIDKMVAEVGQDRVLGFPCDFNDVSTIEKIVKDAVVPLGQLDGFVYAVGVGDVRPLKMCKPDFMSKVMNINFFSFVELVRVLSAKGLANPSGMNIVGVSALGAFMGNATKTAYCASKGAMNAAVRCMAKELAPRHIRINTVAPGVTDTKMFREAQEYGNDSEAFRQITERQYLGICRPDDIADAVLFLLSDYSRMITGCCLPVDGGKLTS